MFLSLNKRYNICVEPQMPVQAVTPAGLDHSKSLEKAELYPALYPGQDQSKSMPSTSTPTAQMYPPVNTFTPNRPSDAYRCVSQSVIIVTSF